MKTLKYAGRFLMRSKSYTIINLLGLAFSLACCIVLMRYIHRELTVDSHCIDPQHIIIPLRDIDGNIHPGSLEQGWSDTDSTYIPENKIVEQCRLQAQQRDNVKYENSNYAMNIMAVDSTFFHFFRYPVLTGEARLTAPDDAVITRQYARRLFGKENPVGKVVEYYGKDVIIRGVIDEPGCKTLLRFDMLVSYNYPSSVSGVSIDYLNIRQLSVEQGEMFSENDIRTAAKVCVIGKTIVDNLFPDGSDPIGKVIRCNQIPMRVVGVLKSKGYNSMGQDQDDVVLAPYTTVMKRLLAQTYLGGIFASALTEDMTEEAVEEITSILRREHKLKATDDDDFTIRTQQELSSMLNTTTDLMTTLLACIAGISLVVGGIGIMNIMYVSVTERTREIGLRMSVGARGVDILSQFLIEAILISITGGVIGVIIGCGASFMIKSIAHWPVFIQPWSVLLSFAVCTITGVFFGWYPAKKAADLDPIDAIRYE